MKRIENITPTMFQYQPGDMTRYIFTYQEQDMFDGTTFIWCFSNLAPGFNFSGQQAKYELRDVQFPPNDIELWPANREVLDKVLRSWWIDDIIGDIKGSANRYTILAGTLCWLELKKDHRI